MLVLNIFAAPTPNLQIADGAVVQITSATWNGDTEAAITTVDWTWSGEEVDYWEVTGSYLGLQWGGTHVSYELRTFTGNSPADLAQVVGHLVGGGTIYSEWFPVSVPPPAIVATLVGSELSWTANFDPADIPGAVAWAIAYKQEPDGEVGLSIDASYEASTADLSGLQAGYYAVCIEGKDGVLLDPISEFFHYTS